VLKVYVYDYKFRMAWKCGSTWAVRIIISIGGIQAIHSNLNKR